MDANRFDDLVVDLVNEDTSRRSLFGRIAAGTIGGALTALGLVGVAPDEVEAKKGCFRRCRKIKNKNKRRQCKRACRRQTPTPAGFAITNITFELLNAVCTPAGNECGRSNTSGLECVGLTCLPIDIGDVCVTGADCSSGRCTAGLCAACDVISVCGSGDKRQCCVADADCISGICVLPNG
ncbi:MAG: hypothetical protein U0031_22410 [Thermomicrobiales bacterium]